MYKGLEIKKVSKKLNFWKKYKSLLIFDKTELNEVLTES